MASKQLDERLCGPMLKNGGLLPQYTQAKIRWKEERAHAAFFLLGVSTSQC